ncbi:pyranose dehydrogenase [Mycena rebaudengoi]|nr:pyranose dehydrogenase [Mycena rebaudengoi]
MSEKALYSIALVNDYLPRSTLCSGAILQNVADLTKLKLTFDYIVVSGTAGNVVASRLSESGVYKVLVLEAGGSDVGVLAITVPFLCTSATPNTAQDWNYTTTPQAALNGRSLAYNRGFVLGGSSSVNFMAYTRGSKEDFDRIATASGDQGWSWNNLLPYMKKNERFVKPASLTNPAQYSPAVHGTTGVNTVSLAGFPADIDSRVIQTTKQLAEFPYNVDMNSGSHLGVGWLQSTIKDGERSSSSTSYLATDCIKRSNLFVLLNARATRVLQTAVGQIRTVEFVQDLKGQKYTLTAKKELILSGGSIGTPHILLNSGIGDTAKLAALGVQPLINLPSVGQNLSDHALASAAWRVTSTNTFEMIARNATLAGQMVGQWAQSRTGQMVATPLSQLAWLRVPDKSAIFKRFPDPTAGTNTAHYELIFSAGYFGPLPATGNYMGIASAVVSPAARGSVTLKSNNPLEAPLINPDILGSEIDMFFMRESIRASLRFAAAPAWAGYVIEPIHFNSSSTDAQLDTFIRSNAGTVYHPVGTAAMSAKTAKYGVVNPDLRVKGVSGLRIVDLPVLPFIPAAHTQAAAYIIAEKASDLIKASQISSLTDGYNALPTFFIIFAFVLHSLLFYITSGFLLA